MASYGLQPQPQTQLVRFFFSLNRVNELINLSFSILLSLNLFLLLSLLLAEELVESEGDEAKNGNVGGADLLDGLLARSDVPDDISGLQDQEHDPPQKQEEDDAAEEANSTYDGNSLSIGRVVAAHCTHDPNEDADSNQCDARSHQNCDKLCLPGAEGYGLLRGGPVFQ